MSDVVKRYYDEQVEREWQRLERPYRRLEMVSTLRLIEETFPKEGRVADIGGGPGRYSMELLRRGYRTTLVDLSPKAIDFAQDRFAEAGLVADATVAANACDLSFLPSASFDAGLLLGPLYHIVEESDRREALGEFHRILKPGGGLYMAVFMQTWYNSNMRARYEQGEKDTGERGSFLAINSETGRIDYQAKHYSERELVYLIVRAGFTIEHFSYHVFTTRSGNRVNGCVIWVKNEKL